MLRGSGFPPPQGTSPRPPGGCGGGGVGFGGVGNKSGRVFSGFVFAFLFFLRFGGFLVFWLETYNCRDFWGSASSKPTTVPYPCSTLHALLPVSVYVSSQ